MWTSHKRVIIRCSYYCQHFARGRAIIAITSLHGLEMATETCQVSDPTSPRPAAESPGALGGYENEFVDPPPDELCCLVCALPYREPHLLGCCGKKICEPCITRVRLAGKPCPFCNPQPIATILDKELHAKVLTMPTRSLCLH